MNNVDAELLKVLDEQIWLDGGRGDDDVERRVPESLGVRHRRLHHCQDEVGGEGAFVRLIDDNVAILGEGAVLAPDLQQAAVRSVHNLGSLLPLISNRTRT